MRYESHRTKKDPTDEHQQWITHMMLCGMFTMFIHSFAVRLLISFRKVWALSLSYSIVSVRIQLSTFAWHSDSSQWYAVHIMVKEHQCTDDRKARSALTDGAIAVSTHSSLH